MEQKTIALEKLIPGALSIELRNHQFGTVQFYSWSHDTDVIYVQIDIAISIFTELSTKKMYDKGYFRIRKDQEEEVLNKAVAAGFYHGQVDAKTATKTTTLERTDIEALLRKNNKNAVKELIGRNDRVELSNLVEVAIALQSELTQAMIDLIEKELQVPIRIEDDYPIEE